MLCRIFNCLI